uniref:Malonyl-CoA:ACP transacylase (MAT) domain-containing protein n=1 Tax=Romanomermis culicivorax TaxID=13658 RepID=A0A915J8Y2_ROMCU
MIPSVSVLKAAPKSRNHVVVKAFVRSLRSGSGSSKKKHPVIDSSQKPRFAPPDNETMRLLRDSANFSDLKSPAMLEDPWTSELYPKSVLKNATDDSKEDTSTRSIDPAQASIILFPGQGSQYVGMGAELLKRNSLNIKKMFENASQILRYDLAKMCVAGPHKELNKTVYCQPAIFVCSMAAIERLKQEKPSMAQHEFFETSVRTKHFFSRFLSKRLLQVIENCVGTAGFSVGEYAALVFAGSLTFENGTLLSFISKIKLIKIRAEAMQRASETTNSGLMTVFLNFRSKLPLAISGAKQWVNEQKGYEPICSVANYLFTECKVIGGDE